MYYSIKNIYGLDTIITNGGIHNLINSQEEVLDNPNDYYNDSYIRIMPIVSDSAFVIKVKNIGKSPIYLDVYNCYCHVFHEQGVINRSNADLNIAPSQECTYVLQPLDFYKFTMIGIKSSMLTTIECETIEEARRELFMRGPVSLSLRFVIEKESRDYTFKFKNGPSYILTRKEIDTTLTTHLKYLESTIVDMTKSAL